MIYKICGFLIFAFCANTIELTQSVGVKGILLCEGEPAKDVLINVYDKDSTERLRNRWKKPRLRGAKWRIPLSLVASAINIDNKLANVTTDSRGYFEAEGTQENSTTIAPVMNIYHDCDDGIKPCKRKLSIHIPNQYITNSTEPEGFFDFGTFELAGVFEGEERDCLN